MTVEGRKPLRRGLNIGVDPAQTAGMVLADGARFDIDGVVTSRFGQTPVSLSFPQEYSEAPATVTMDPYILSAKDFGIGSFYDQRIVTTAPQHLNDTSFSETTTYWEVTDSFTFPSSTTTLARYDFAFGTNVGTLRQLLAKYLVSFDTSKTRTYEIKFSVTNDHPTGISTMTITGPDSGQSIDLHALGYHNTGDYVVYMTIPAGATIGNFTVTVTDNGGFTTGSMDISYFEIREVVNTSLVPPARLNFVYKGSGGTIWINDENPASSSYYDGVAYLGGNKRARIVSYGHEVYIVDPENRPVVMRWQPEYNQRYLDRAKYDLRNCGIAWPRSNSDIPKIREAGAGTDLEVGLYRFRLVLENRQGDYSNPSLTTFEQKYSNGFNPKIYFPSLPSSLTTGDNACKWWRVYVSYEPATENATGVLNPYGDGPTAFRFWTRVPIATASIELTQSDMEKRNQEELIAWERGAPPKLLDFQIINDVAYGIANYDVILRETAILDGPGRPLHFKARNRVETSYNVALERQAYDSAEISEMRVSPEFLMFSPPGEPQYMEHWVRFGKGGEIGVGIGELGNKPIIFTNVGILVWDPDTLELRRVPSDTGCASRDSIQRSGSGLRFMGSDGVPRYFNGANVERVDNEVFPIFAKDDYVGDYGIFDRSRVEEISSASGESTYMMTYPEKGGGRRLLIGYAKPSGEIEYGIDKRNVRSIMWLGKENQWVATFDDQSMMYLEDGFVDKVPIPGGGYLDQAPGFAWKFRWFGSENRGITRFKKLKLDIDTKGTSVVVTMTVDKKAVLTKSVTLQSSGRQLLETGIPPWFKGQYLDLLFQGETHSTSGRPELYDLQVETVGMGVY